MANINATSRSAANQIIDYDAIEKMDSFNRFVKRKNTFLFSTVGLFLFLYIMLPILAFQPVLQQKAVGNITWVWIYSAGLFVMTVILCTVYVKKAEKFDKEAAAVLAEYVALKGGK